MPADLDDIFGSLARQADAIPLGTADQARLRGRQRNRNGVIAAVAAVCVVLAGAGVLARPQRHAPDTVAPAQSPGALPMVGSPIEFRRSVTEASTAIVGDRVISAWQAGDVVDVVAADLHTAQTLWRITGLDGFAGTAKLRNLVAVKQAVMVTIDDGADDTVHVMDPTGASNDAWVLTVAEDDELVPYENALLRRWAVNGQLDAYDWRTGQKLWSIDAGADPPMRLIGVRAKGQTMSRDSFTDDRVLVATKGGKVQVRDARRGTLLRTITPASVPTESSWLITHDGWLYDGGPSCCDTAAYRVVASELNTGASNVILSEGPRTTITGIDVCGQGLVCVLDQEPDGRTSVSAVDAAKRKRIWTVAGPPGAGSVSSDGKTMLLGGGGTTVLLGNDGRTLFSTPDAHVDWLGDDRLLVLPTTGAGEVSTVRIADGRTTPLGSVPQRVDACVHTTDRLACPTTTGLNIYSLAG